MPYKKKTVPATTNNITRAIINFLNSEGHHAVRINTMGTYSEKLKKYIKNGSTNGVLDISCTLAPSGRHLVVDVKKGKDVLSDDQIAFVGCVLRSGGLVCIASSIDEFINYYNQFYK